jgi:UPF0755 protein
MMFRGKAWLLALVVATVLLFAVGRFFYTWYGPDPGEGHTFVVPDGVALWSISAKLEKEGAIPRPRSARMPLFGSDEPIKAGEFLLPRHASASEILKILQGAEGTIRRMVTVPEGLPSIMVYERLMNQPLLTGRVACRKKARSCPTAMLSSVARAARRCKRMQAAMDKTLADLWAKRSPDTVAKTRATR